MKEHSKYTKDIEAPDTLKAVAAYLLFFLIALVGLTRKILQQI